MRPFTTHFEQIPVAVVTKIAAHTPKRVSSGGRARPGPAGIQAPASSRPESAAGPTTRPRASGAAFESPPDRGVR